VRISATPTSSDGASAAAMRPGSKLVVGPWPESPWVITFESL
jgi:hypothetical protein